MAQAATRRTSGASSPASALRSAARDSRFSNCPRATAAAARTTGSRRPGARRRRARRRSGPRCARGTTRRWPGRPPTCPSGPSRCGRPGQVAPIMPRATSAAARSGADADASRPPTSPARDVSPVRPRIVAESWRSQGSTAARPTRNARRSSGVTARCGAAERTRPRTSDPRGITGAPQPPPHPPLLIPSAANMQIEGGDAAARIEELAEIGPAGHRGGTGPSRQDARPGTR